MAKNFRELEAKMSPESRARVAEKVKKVKAQMALDELRQARQMTQESLATILNVKQSSVSKMEKRTDMYVSTLKTFVKAMGGELHIVASFPDRGNVEINQFEDIDEKKALGAGAAGD